MIGRLLPVLIFLALELLSIPLYIMAGMAWRLMNDGGRTWHRYGLVPFSVVTTK